MDNQIKNSIIRKTNLGNRTYILAEYRLVAVFYETFNTSKTNEIVSYSRGEDGTDYEWSALKNHGFACSKTVLSLVNNSQLEFANLKVLAFVNLDEKDFPKNQLYEQCKIEIRTSDFIPIIVGAFLGGLVIIVLIAYFIGRARSNRQGYASVFTIQTSDV